MPLPRHASFVNVFFAERPSNTNTHYNWHHMWHCDVMAWRHMMMWCHGITSDDIFMSWTRGSISRVPPPVRLSQLPEAIKKELLSNTLYICGLYWWYFMPKQRSCLIQSDSTFRQILTWFNICSRFVMGFLAAFMEKTIFQNDKLWLFLGL